MALTVVYRYIKAVKLAKLSNPAERNRVQSSPSRVEALLGDGKREYLVSN